MVAGRLRRLLTDRDTSVWHTYLLLNVIDSCQKYAINQEALLFETFVAAVGHARPSKMDASPCLIGTIPFRKRRSKAWWQA